MFAIYNVVCYDGKISWVKQLILSPDTANVDADRYYQNSDVNIVFYEAQQSISLREIFALYDADRKNELVLDFIALYSKEF